MGEVEVAVGEADEIEHFQGAAAGVTGGFATEEKGEFDILDDGHGGEEIEELEDDAHLVAAVAGEAGVGGVVEREIADPDLAGVGVVEAAEKVEESAFTTSAGSGDDGELAGINVEAHVVEGPDGGFAAGVNSGDVLKADHGMMETRRVRPENQADFRVLGETPDYLAVDKPTGMLVHPTKPGGPWTLWDGLKALLGYELATGGQVSIINRLDRETSGVVLVAKNSAAARQAGLAMQRGQIAKEYLALVFGWPEWETQRMDAPILRRGEVEESAVYLERMVHEKGSVAVTDFEVLERGSRGNGEKFALVRAKPKTGRTHQIRVHAAALGHAVIGDKIYAKGSGHYLDFIREGWTEEMERELWLPRQALHCAGMRLGEVEWRSGLPADMEGFIEECARGARQ